MKSEPTGKNPLQEANDYLLEAAWGAESMRRIREKFGDVFVVDPGPVRCSRWMDGVMYGDTQ